MKSKLLSFSLGMIAAVTGLAGDLAASAQTDDRQPQIATLQARRKTAERDNYIDAAFSFEHGVNGEAGKQITRNDWDLLFGNSPVPDSFDVTMVVDDCSRIKDLGALTWGTHLRIRPLPAHVKPTREPSVKAVVGHMYLVHTADQDSDLYALFRVEALEPGKSVTISWKLIPSPDEQRVYP